MFIYFFHPVKNNRLNYVALYILDNYAGNPVPKYFYILMFVYINLGYSVVEDLVTL
jgi:hypothetical protein